MVKVVSSVRLLLLLGFALVSAAAAPPPHSAAAAGPTAMIAQFHEGLARAARSASGKAAEARQAAFRPVVTASYDTHLMARIAAGSYWDRLSETERDELAQAFTDLTIANYAARFRVYSSQQFIVQGEEAAPQDRALVRAQIKRRSGEAVGISYLLERSATPLGWSIIDVWLNNSVSELALRRAEFSPVLRDKGGAALIADLRSKIAALPNDDEKRKGKTRMN